MSITTRTIDAAVKDARAPGAAVGGSRVDTSAERWIGRPIPRKEDERFIRGAGRYVSDFCLENELVAFALRSPVAAARIRNIDPSSALARPGVVAVLTGRDVTDAGLGGIPWEVCPPGVTAAFPGDPAIAEPQPLIAQDRVRYVGEILAFVLAESLAAARDGAEAIEVLFEDTAAIVDGAAALEPDAPRVGRDGNLLFEHRVGDAAGTAAAFASADLIVTVETHVPRLNAAPIEPRGYIGRYDADHDIATLIASAGKPHPVRNTIANQILHIDPTRLRVLAPDIGGGFGGKNVVHAEAALVLFAARRLGRPVRWIGLREEAFLSDMQARDHTITARLALDAAGNFVAIDYSSIVNLGAYLAPRAVNPCVSGLNVLSGPYRIGFVSGRVRAVFTNTVPTCPYRGAGVPETAYVVERLVDKAARLLRRDPGALRHQNLVLPAMLPWVLPSGHTLHSVDYPTLLTAAAAYLRRAPALPIAAGERRGLGIAFTVEAYGTSLGESAAVTLRANGEVELRIGTKSGGQSHETVYAQIIADVLGVIPDAVTVVQGDTDRIARGNGTGASRSMTIGGTAVFKAAEALIEALRPLAAQLLQATPDMVTFQDGRFLNPRGASVGLAAVANSARGHEVTAEVDYRPLLYNFPGGCHMAEVAVDLETGTVRLMRYAAAHDCGTALNPMVVVGQIHGGLAQGIGAALKEEVRYDEAGQLLTGSFLDYAMVRADDLPSFEIALHATPCASNPMGAKAVGEAGPVAAPPVIINAIIDALADLGVEDVEMPATPERIWEALAPARAAVQARRKSNAAPAGA